VSRRRKRADSVVAGFIAPARSATRVRWVTQHLGGRTPLIRGLKSRAWLRNCIALQCSPGCLRAGFDSVKGKSESGINGLLPRKRVPLFRFASLRRPTAPVPSARKTPVVVLHEQLPDQQNRRLREPFLRGHLQHSAATRNFVQCFLFRSPAAEEGGAQGN
jgi:hypothetical protein